MSLLRFLLLMAIHVCYLMLYNMLSTDYVCVALSSSSRDVAMSRYLLNARDDQQSNTVVKWRFGPLPLHVQHSHEWTIFETTLHLMEQHLPIESSLWAHDRAHLRSVVI